jgi:hypothetical protein
MHVPDILHLCRDSRAVGLKHYSKGFKTSRDEPTENHKTGGESPCTRRALMRDSTDGFYWDKTRDIVYLQHTKYMPSADFLHIWVDYPKVLFERVRYMTMEADLLDVFYFFQFRNCVWEGVHTLFIEGCRTGNDLQQHQTWQDTWLQYIFKNNGLCVEKDELKRCVFVRSLEEIFEFIKDERLEVLKSSTW